MASGNWGCTAKLFSQIKLRLLPSVTPLQLGYNQIYTRQMLCSIPWIKTCGLNALNGRNSNIILVAFKHNCQCTLLSVGVVKVATDKPQHAGMVLEGHHYSELIICCQLLWHHNTTKSPVCHPRQKPGWRQSTFKENYKSHHQKCSRIRVIRLLQDIPGCSHSLFEPQFHASHCEVL